MNRQTRNTIRLEMLLGVLAMAISLAGCEGKSLSVALKASTITLKQVDDARAAHQISDKTWTETIVPARNATVAIMDQIVASYVGGVPFDWRAALQRLSLAIAPLQRQQELIQGSK